MKYWNVKINNNIFSFSDLYLFQNKLSERTYFHIYNMIEWELLEQDEKIKFFSLFSIYNFIFLKKNTKKNNSQEKKQIISFIKEYPYVIDWLLQNWDHIFETLSLEHYYPDQELFYFLSKNIKFVRYNFKFTLKEQKNKTNENDQWNIRFYDNNELFNFIKIAKENNKYISISYLFNKNATLDNLAKSQNPVLTRERIRQIVSKEIEKNTIFFQKIYDFFDKDILSVKEANKAAVRVIEKKLYPKIDSLNSILSKDFVFKNKIFYNFKENPEFFLKLSSNSEELKILIENNCVVLSKGFFHKIDEKFWGNKVLSFKKMLIIFLKLNYKDTEILDIFKLQKEFYNFLVENNKVNENYILSNFRPFESLVSRTKELLYYDRTEYIVSFDENINNSKIADFILKEFINLKQQGIIMVSTEKFIELFNNLTNYKFLNFNKDVLHNFLKKNSTIKNKEIYFSRMPILVNANYSSVIEIFYKQVQILFNNTKVIEWNILLDVLTNECGLEKKLIQNYISDGYKYFAKKDNNVILL